MRTTKTAAGTLNAVDIDWLDISYQIISPAVQRIHDAIYTRNDLELGWQALAEVPPMEEFHVANIYITSLAEKALLLAAYSPASVEDSVADLKRVFCSRMETLIPEEGLPVPAADSDPKIIATYNNAVKTREEAAQLFDATWGQLKEAFSQWHGQQIAKQGASTPGRK